MKTVQFAFVLSLFQPLAAQTAFTSIYVFGDGVCTTTSNTSPLSYYENRFCNGPVWVEVLSEWQGLPYEESKNDSAFGFESVELLDKLTNPGAADPFVTPADVATALFVVWTSNADYVEFQSGESSVPYDSQEDLDQWNAFKDTVVLDQKAIVQDLYDRGARSIMIPLAVDFVAVPFYSLGTQDSDFVELRINEYNAALISEIEVLASSLAGLKIYFPDTFSFFEEILANPADFGATVTTIGAVQAFFDPLDFSVPAFDSAGADYVFWDRYHPTARIQVYLADLFQQELTPAEISKISPASGQIEIRNSPVGRPGIVFGSDDLLDWDIDVSSFTSSSTLHTETVPASDPARYYQVGFPVPEANLPAGP